MVRFGRQDLVDENLPFFGRLYYLICGIPNIGSYIRSLHFKKYIKKLEWWHALDAGCGSGEFAFYLAEKYPDRKIDACDKNDIKKQINLKAKLKLDNLDIFKCDLFELDSKNKYDLIYLIDVLIYFSDKENKAILKNLFNALKFGGYLFFHSPQKNWSEVNILDKKHYPDQYKYNTQQKPGHLYSLDEITKIFETIGFQLCLSKKTFGFFGKFSWELDKLLLEKNYYHLRAFLMPFLKSLAIFDKIGNNKKGGGILVLAKKNAP